MNGLVRANYVWSFVLLAGGLCAGCQSGRHPEVSPNLERQPAIVQAATVQARLMRRGPVELRINAKKSVGKFNRVWADVNGGLRSISFRTVRLDGADLLDGAYPARNQYAWYKADTILDRISRQSRSVLLTLAGTPAWLVPAGGVADRSSPPDDLLAWTELVRSTVRHLSVEKGHSIFGIEIWDKTTDPARWRGTADQYFDLYETSVQAVKQTAPAINVGGPAAASWRPDRVGALVKHCVRKNVPLDFISWRTAATDPKEYGRQAAETRKLVRQSGLWPVPPLILDDWGYPGRSADRDVSFLTAYTAASCRQIENAGYAYAFGSDSLPTRVTSAIMNCFGDERLEATSSAEPEGIGVMAGTGRVPNEIVVAMWWWLDTDAATSATTAVHLDITGLDTNILYGWEMYGADRTGKSSVPVHMGAGDVPARSETFEIDIGLPLYGLEMVRLVPE